MKKNFSGILAFILAIVMCVCMVPAAMADEGYENDGITTSQVCQCRIVPKAKPLSFSSL